MPGTEAAAREFVDFKEASVSNSIIFIGPFAGDTWGASAGAGDSILTSGLVVAPELPLNSIIFMLLRVRGAFTDLNAWFCSTALLTAASTDNDAFFERSARSASVGEERFTKG